MSYSPTIEIRDEAVYRYSYLLYYILGLSYPSKYIWVNQQAKEKEDDILIYQILTCALLREFLYGQATNIEDFSTKSYK